jgi:hypothetical protein
MSYEFTTALAYLNDFHDAPSEALLYAARLADTCRSELAGELRVLFRDAAEQDALTEDGQGNDYFYGAAHAALIAAARRAYADGNE